MKILQTIAGLGAYSGGTSTCTYDLLSAMHRTGGCDVDLLTLRCNDMLGQGEKWIKALPNDAVSPYGYSHNIKHFLQQSDYDLYHTNGLWMHCNHATCAAALHKGKPYIITPHGMLYPGALHRSYWKKWPLLGLFFKRDIRQARCLHVTCKTEMQHVRTFGYGGVVAVIPNPAIMPDYLDEIASSKPSFLKLNQPMKFGFLGRLHPVKKVENLIYGVDLLPREANYHLIIMGKGNDEYEQFLRNETARLKLENRVHFRGFVSGREKYEQLAQMACLFVPSDFENFGMIVTEALSVGTPVMASLGTPWEELNTHGCGWWVDRSPENIATVMQQVLDMDTNKLLEMGYAGRKLVADKYTATHVAMMMKQLYFWILNGGEKPEFIYE